ncbi:hypothetical protein AB0I82_11285 [Streptomyces sp. NPDC050315]|uniref:hypothetical protein n=1 Tax=Streptomyces sp. NPDC050315 TaxID=3155039 RepID=UPI00343C9FE2
MEIKLKPEEIPQYTGDLAQLEKDHAALTKDAGHIRTTGSDVHSHFQGLSAYYKAPEAEQLFATTKPVKDRADGFADDLETVASALSDYADEIRPLTTKLADLKKKAQAFIRDHKDDDDADYDDELTAEHNQIRDDINATVAAFWAAERTCYNKIVALWNGPKMVAGDGSKKEHQYGFKAEDLKNAKVPWGDPVELKHHWYDVGHWVKSFAWDGIVVDGIWGTIKGLGTLVGVDGWDAAGQAWKGLAQLGTGLAILTVGGPGAAAFMALPDDKLPSWLRDSRNTMKETGKALVAWDEWGKNPGRAAGGVTFNVLTTVFTGGAGGAAAGAGKAGAVAKALSVAGKAGKVIDPMTYVGKGVGAGLSKVGDIAKSLKGIGRIDMPALPENAVELPEGSVALPDGTVNLPEGAAIPKGALELPGAGVKLPEGSVPLPEGTAKLTDFDGNTVYVDPKGNLYDGTGAIKQHHAEAPADMVDNATHPTTDATTPRVEAPASGRVLVGAGAAHTADNAAHLHLGDSLDTTFDDTGRITDDVNAPGGHHGDMSGSGPGHVPGGSAHDLGHGPSAHHEPSTGGNHTGGQGDGLAGGHSNGASGGHAHDSGGNSGVHDDPAGGHGEGASGGMGGTGRIADDAATPAHHPDGGAGNSGTGHGGERQLTPEELKKIQDEHVRKANEDPAWRAEHYDELGRRKRIGKVVDGAQLPQLTKNAEGKWIAAHDQPSGPSESKFGAKPLGPDTVPDGNLPELDRTTANRKASVDLINAEKAFDDAPTPEAEQALAKAREAYTDRLGTTPNNSKISETLGEKAAALHVVPHSFPDAEVVPLPKTPNGANMFDQVYRLDSDGHYLVVEAKAPSGDLDWRHGRADPEDPANPHVGDDGGAKGMRVKQGTRLYVRTILGEMTRRGGRDAEIAADLRTALKEGKLQYVLVKAAKPNGSNYAGAVLEYLKI